jgi:NitT/TauT family transport system permease protein
VSGRKVLPPATSLVTTESVQQQTRRRSTSRGRLRVSTATLVSVASLLLLLAVWWLATGLGAVSPKTVPSPPDLITTYKQLFSHGYAGTSLVGHLEASLRRVVIGFAIGGSSGLVLGTLAGFSRFVSAAVSPIVALVRPIPPIAYLPVLVVILGIGETSKITLIAMAAFFYMYLTTSAAVRSVPAGYVRAGQMLGLSRLQISTSVLLRAGMPQLLTGLNVALVISWATVVAAELIASSTGLGFVAVDASTYYRLNVVYAVVIIIGLVGALIELVVRSIERFLDPQSR